jgi:hypothetical protein
VVIRPVKPLGLGFTGLLRAERELLSADGTWQFTGDSSPTVTLEGARRWAISACTTKLHSTAGFVMRALKRRQARFKVIAYLLSEEMDFVQNI